MSIQIAASIRKLAETTAVPELEQAFKQIESALRKDGYRKNHLALKLLADAWQQYLPGWLKVLETQLLKDGYAHTDTVMQAIRNLLIELQAHHQQRQLVREPEAWTALAKYVKQHHGLPGIGHGFVRDVSAGRPYIEIDPTHRSRLDHFGSDDSFDDEDDHAQDAAEERRREEWQNNYAKPLEVHVFATLVKILGAELAKTLSEQIEIDEKGYVTIERPA